MAKFLDTTGVSYHLQQLINKSNERLILISPYLKINDRIKQALEDKNRLKIDIRVIYGKNELQPEENNWLKSMTSIRSSFCKDLHAKCYMNEKEAIVTSMNLYEFSQVNNNEIGIYVEKSLDPELFKDLYEEVQRLIRNSDEIIVSVEKAPKKEKHSETTQKTKQVDKKNTGYCIRTGIEIPFNLEKLLCFEAYQKWSEFGNLDFPENFCHYSGEPSYGKTCVDRKSVV